MDRTGLDPRTVNSVTDDSPITVANITTIGERLVEAYPTGLTMSNLVLAVQFILHLTKKDMKLTRAQKRQFIIDSLRYTIDNTNSGPTLEQLDDVVKEMVPTIVDAFIDRSVICKCCFF